MKRVKTYAFWVALSSAVVILVQSIANLFGFSIDSSTIENVIMSICGVLVVLGIVVNPNTEDGDNVKDDENVNVDKEAEISKQEKIEQSNDAKNTK